VKDKQALLFVVSIALLLTLFFWFCTEKEYHAISMAHGNVALNMYRYNNPGINTRLAQHMHVVQHGVQELVDFNEVRDREFGQPDAPFPVNDTIGYGVLLGLLWKVTGSLLFTDVIVLQILMYLIMVFLIYQTGLLLFRCKHVALCSAIAFLCYLPLIALSVHAVRDVWAAYGGIVLLYAIFAYIRHKKSGWFFVWACVFFALCQWIRPSLFLGVITAAIVLLACALYEYRDWVQLKKRLYAVIVLLVTNALFFWIPFIQYNKQQYGRYIVSPAGQDLLEGLGEFENPWGYQLSDQYVAQLIENKSGYAYGTSEFDDAARQEFMRAYHEYPALFWMNIGKRLPMCILPPLPWLFYAQSPYAPCNTMQEKVSALLASPKLWIDCIARHVYMRLYILLGWCGLLLLLWRKKYEAVLSVIVVLLASSAKLPSHIEYRYLTPYYWVLCFCVGYICYTAFFAESCRY